MVDESSQHSEKLPTIFDTSCRQSAEQFWVNIVHDHKQIDEEDGE